MIDVSVSKQLSEKIPDFRAGVITYSQLTIGDLPEVISDQLPLFYHNIRLSLEAQDLSSIPGVQEWRTLFKQAGTDPSRYRPSQEALLRRIRRDGQPHQVNSAVDLNNFFSIQFSIPIGIYDADKLQSPVRLTIGSGDDQYAALNGRVMDMEDKIISTDQDGPFGSPIVDSERSCLTPETRNALQIVYLRPSVSAGDAARIVKKISEMFVHVLGGISDWDIIK